MNLLAISWWLLFANVGAAIVDTESLQSCISRETCQEANPIFQVSNSRFYHYGTKAVIIVPLFLLHEKTNSKTLKWALVASATSQGIFGALNLRF